MLFLIFFLWIGSASAATVLSYAQCGGGNGTLRVGDYAAECGYSYVDGVGRFVSDTESAHISINTLMDIDASAGSSGTYQFGAGEAYALFSAQYVLTLNGGVNLAGNLGVGAFVEPCLSLLGGRGPSVAAIGPWGLSAPTGSSVSASVCDGSASVIRIPFVAGVPETLTLTLRADTGGYYQPGFARASFNGFRFFDSNATTANLLDVPYTLTLQDTLPIPEPGAVTMVLLAAMAAPLLKRIEKLRTAR